MQSQICIIAKQKDTVLYQYVKNQLSTTFEVEEVNMSTLLNETPKAPNTFHLLISEGLDFAEILKVGEVCRKSLLPMLFVGFYKNDLVLGPYNKKECSTVDSAYFFLKHRELDRLPKLQELEEIKVPVIRSQSQISLIVLAKIYTIVVKEFTYFIQQKGKAHRYIDRLIIQSLMDENRTSELRIHSVFKSENTISFHQEFDTSLNKTLSFKKQIEAKDSFVFHNYQRRKSVQSIGIIGGGTAGYLTALALKKDYPDMMVTLIESSKIPVIGVGEATTPDLNQFLFERLGLDKVSFYERVTPTWKLGIAFDWGPKEKDKFYYPFCQSENLASLKKYKNINNGCLNSILMNQNKTLVFRTEDDSSSGMGYDSLLDDFAYAYHIDNKNFINYLKEEATKAGILYVDDLIVDAIKKSEEDEILECVIGENNDTYRFDFFVDCTGFKSLLIEKVQGSEFVSFSDSLFTDSAFTFKRNNNGSPRPYTTAKAMNNGWCWNTPLRSEDHLGYVFSSSHTSLEKVQQELIEKFPNLEFGKLVRFRSGRHTKFCAGNVVAIGNSYAFVEPLESTGIHMITEEINLFVKNLASLPGTATSKCINDDMARRWDYLKFFLALHFKFNNAWQTEFWRDCRDKTDIQEYEWMIKLFKESGPLSYTKNEDMSDYLKKNIHDKLFGLGGIDTILLGQGFYPRDFGLREINSLSWENGYKSWMYLAERSLNQRDALEQIIKTPSLL
ncbi:MAG: tryptophan 7-halogenase [Bacteroidota bacterium]